MHSHVTFWAVTVFFPFLLVFASAVIRVTIGVKQTALADTILAVIAFEAVVLADTDPFVGLIKIELVKENLRVSYLTLLILSIVVWVICVAVIEKKVQTENAQRRFDLAIRFFWFFVGLAITCFSLVAAISPFVVTA